jgi:hypothetical protein
MVELNAGYRTAYLTLDTTGLPGSIPGWTPRIVALGIAVVENGEVINSTGGLIHQPAHHVRDPRARGAWHSNGIEPTDVVDTTTTENQVAASVKDAVTGCTLRGYNVEFLHDFLSREPFGLNEWGECVMKEAAGKLRRIITWAHGGLGSITRYPALNEALYWASSQGHDVMPPDNTKTRAHANAVRVAKLAIALRKEQ